MTAPAVTLVDVPTSEIAASPDQYREVFDPVALAELAAQIAEVGLQLPVRVRPAPGGGYVLVDGERRLRAVRDVLQRPTILAVVDPAEHDAATLAIATWVANQRVDPGPLEDARGLRAIMDTADCTVSELADKVGKRVQWVRDRLALLELADDVAHYVQTGQLPIGRAVLMAALDVNRQRMALEAHQRVIGADAFRALVGRLEDEQAADAMFDPDAFMVVDEYVVDALEAVEDAKRADVVRERPMGVSEIAEALEVRPQTVHQWRVRGRFPEPELRVGGSPAWWESTVLAWARETGR